MKYIQYLILIIISVFFTSCVNIADNITWTGLIILFAVLIALFAFMFFLIFRRKRQADRRLAQFSASVHTMLQKFDEPENKIGALKALIRRINEDEKYKKDTTWRDQVLAKTYSHLATQYHALDDLDNTLKACAEILRLTPDDAMTLYNRGSIYFNRGEYEKALVDLNSSIELVDDYASAYNNRGTVYSKLGKDDYAFADFNKALEIEESAIIYMNRGDAHKAVGNIEKAREDYGTALRLCAEGDSVLKTEITHAIESLDGQ